MLTKPGKTKQWEIDPMQATLVTLTSDTLLWSEIPFPPLLQRCKMVPNNLRVLVIPA